MQPAVSSLMSRARSQMTKRGATGHMLLSNRFLKVTIHDLSVMEQNSNSTQRGKRQGTEGEHRAQRGHHETKAAVENSMGGDGGRGDERRGA